MMSAKNILYDWFNVVWNEKNTQAIPNYLSQDALSYGLQPSRVVAGISAFEKFLKSFHDQFHDLRIVVSEATSEGNRQTVLCTISAFHVVKEREVCFTGSCIAEIDGARIKEVWYHFDFLAMHEQLGTFEPVINFQVVSYNTLRRAIGFTGLLLPVVIVLGSFLGGLETVLPSISDYYFSTVGDVFVGCLCAVSFFLFCYKGHEPKDSRAANAAAFFALCIALFPTSTELSRQSHIGLVAYETTAAAVHFTSAVLFFLILAYFSLVLFTKSVGKKTKEKKLRNLVYRICGWTIVACLILLAIYFAVDSLKWLERYSIVAAFETVMLWAFGISWLTKSQAIFADEEHQ